MVTEGELAALLHSRGWYLDMIRKYKTRYAYAKRREGRTVVTRYLKSESKFDELTTEEVLNRIQ